MLSAVDSGWSGFTAQWKAIEGSCLWVVTVWIMQLLLQIVTNFTHLLIVSLSWPFCLRCYDH